MDIDRPVRPIDSQEDAKRVESVRAANRRSELTALLTLAQPLVTMAGGAVLGSWHADAPITCAVGMMFAWAGARAVLFAAATVALVFEAPSLLRRLFGRVEEARREPPLFQRSAKPVFALHVLAFATLAALVGVVGGLFGDGTLHALDVLAFGLFGLALGAVTPLTEPT